MTRFTFATTLPCIALLVAIAEPGCGSTSPSGSPSGGKDGSAADGDPMSGDALTGAAGAGGAAGDNDAGDAAAAGAGAGAAGTSGAAGAGGMLADGGGADIGPGGAAGVPAAVDAARPDAPAACPAAPAGKACQNRDAVCSAGTGAATTACFCGDTGNWVCPGAATPPDGGFTACPKNPGGAACPTRDQTCSEGAGRFCLCAHDRTWLCSDGR